MNRRRTPAWLISGLLAFLVLSRMQRQSLVPADPRVSDLDPSKQQIDARLSIPIGTTVTAMALWPRLASFRQK